MFAVRIIPFDIGTSITKNIKEKIVGRCKKGAEETFLFDESVLKLEIATESKPIEIILFKDGIGVASFVEEIPLNPLQGFDPVFALNNRAEVHKAILRHEHPFSGFLDKTIDELREIAECSLDKKRRKMVRKIRFTASKNWEKGGISYCMSIHLIQMPQAVSALEDHNQKDIRRVLAPFMEPAVYRAEDTFSKGELTLFEPNAALVHESHLDEIAERIFSVDYEMDPSIKTYMTWSNVLAIGDVKDHVVEYANLQKKFQHVWFYFHAADVILRKALEEFESEKSRIDVDYLDQLRSDILLRIDEFTNIQESTLSARYLKLFEGFVKTGQLNRMVTRLEKKLELVGLRIEREDVRNREKIGKRTELVLVMLTYLSGASSVLVLVRETNVYIGVLFILPLAFLIIYLYYPKPPYR
jgi:hypothetical protein